MRTAWRDADDPSGTYFQGKCSMRKLSESVALVLIALVVFQGLWAEVVLRPGARAVLLQFCYAQTSIGASICHSKDSFEYWGISGYTWLDLWLGREPARSLKLGLEREVWLRQARGETPDSNLPGVSQPYGRGAALPAGSQG
jgi:hypothetical protein